MTQEEKENRRKKPANIESYGVARSCVAFSNPGHIISAFIPVSLRS